MENPEFFDLDMNMLDHFPNPSNLLQNDGFDAFGDLNFDMEMFGVEILGPSAMNFQSLDDTDQEMSHNEPHNFVNARGSVVASQDRQNHRLTKKDNKKENDSTIELDASSAFPGVETTSSILGCVQQHKNVSAPTNLKVSSKRKWNDSITVFSSISGKEYLPRKRKRFSPERKEEVALNRKIGSCLPCKLKKSSCTFGMPCDSCLKRAGDIALGQQICSRRKLVAVRFDQTDLLSISIYKRRMQHLENLPTIGEPRQVFLCFDRQWLRRGFNDSEDGYIRLPIVTFVDPHYVGNTKVSFWDYWGVTNEYVPDPQSAIKSDCLPTAQQLLGAFNVSHGKALGSGPFKYLQFAIKSFVDIYCERRTELPLQALIHSVFRLQKLFSLYRSAVRTKDSIESTESQFESSSIRLQIRFVIAQEILKIEPQILAQMDKVLFGAGGIGRQNPIGVWLCLWTLIFVYKEHMIMAAYFEDLAYRAKYALSLHMYNTLTSIYSALYKTTSPLSLDHRPEAVSEMLGEDQDLVKAFGEIKVEIYWLQTEMNYLRPEDNGLKTLIVDNEVKLLEEHRNAARKRSSA